MYDLVFLSDTKPQGDLLKVLCKWVALVALVVDVR